MPGAPPPTFQGWAAQYYYQLHPQEIQKIKTWFQSVDQDRSNSISVQELQNVAFGGIPLGYDTSVKLIKVSFCSFLNYGIKITQHLCRCSIKITLEPSTFMSMLPSTNLLSPCKWASPELMRYALFNFPFHPLFLTLLPFSPLPPKRTETAN